MVPVPAGGSEVLRSTTRPGSATGSERNSTAFITLKTAVFAPIPSASVRTQTKVKPGVFLSWRIAYLKSLTSSGMAASQASLCNEHVVGQTPAGIAATKLLDYRGFRRQA